MAHYLIDAIVTLFLVSCCVDLKHSAVANTLRNQMSSTLEGRLSVQESLLFADEIESRSREKRNAEASSPLITRFLFGEETSSSQKDDPRVAVTKLISTDTKPGFVIIKRIEFADENARRLNFSVDRSVQQIMISANSGCGNFTVSSPRENKFEFASQGAGGASADVTEVSRGQSVGQWTVTVHGKSKCNLEVQALSTVGYVLTLLTKNPWENDLVYELLKGNPSKTKSLRLVLDGFGLEMLQSGSKDHPTKISLIDNQGNDVVSPTALGSDTVDGIDSSIEISLNDGLNADGEVNVVVEGMDYDGNLFSRVIPSPIVTSHVVLSCDTQEITIQPGTETTLNVILRNNGLGDTFAVRVMDSQSFSSLANSTIVVDSDVRTVIPIQLSAPSSAKPGVESFIYVTVQGTRVGSSQYTNCTAVVTNPAKPQIRSIFIKGLINSRFAETVVTSMMTNKAGVGLQAEFDVVLPENAFITNLTMTIGGMFIVGTVEEKEKAEKIFEKAKERETTVGQVAAREKSIRIYKTSLFVQPGESVTFQLTYQQLLQRSDGRYKYAVVLNPNQPVNQLDVVVNIVETEPVAFINIPFFDTGINNQALIKHPTGTSIIFRDGRKLVDISYSPSLTQQVALSPYGLSGSFSVIYDVVRSNPYGDVTVSNGYFAHFFYPPNIPVLPKKVVFIIDKSGSMQGEKMQQVKDAFSTILRTLKENDLFDVVVFDSSSNARFGYLRSATPSTVESTINYLGSIYAGGGTSIIPAFSTAFRSMSDPRSSGSRSSKGEKDETSDEGYDQMMVFLTDGRGEAPVSVRSHVKAENENKQVAIHTIAFGRGADEEMLRRIANENGGEYRKVLEGLQSSLQIQDFFDEITNSLLTNVSVAYPTDRISHVTRDDFGTLPVGKELVWAGKITSNPDERRGAAVPTSSDDSNLIIAQISGKHASETIQLNVPIDASPSSPQMLNDQNRIPNFAERLWAFLRVKDLLEQISLSKNENETAQLEAEALNISLQYNFVTPLTSLVVLLPEQRKEIEEELQREEELAAQQTTTTAQAPVTPRPVGPAPIVTPAPAVVPTAPSPHRGYLYGDPHFVISLLRDVKLCFDWGGEDGEVYNLFYEPSSGISINGELCKVSGLRQMDSKPSNSTFVSSLGFILSEHEMEVIIHSDRVMIYPDGEKNFTVPLTYEVDIKKREFKLIVSNVTEEKITLSISIPEWTFNIDIHQIVRGPFQTIHMDLEVRNHNIHSINKVMGLIGQFLNAEVSWDEQVNADERVIKINGRSSVVKRGKRRTFDLHGVVACWKAEAKSREILVGTRKDFLLADLLTVPAF